MKNKKNVLVLEINEVPYRLIDKYKTNPVYKNIRIFFENSWQFTSYTYDSGELSPWITWPTLHRGMNVELHQIRNLGQDISTYQGTTIWDDLRKEGHAIGIFGALQSWPPRDPGPGGFYIPDTFAHDAQCIPSDLNPLQQFNLNQVRRNGRVVSSKIPKLSSALYFLFTALKNGLKFKTILQILFQLVAERFDKTYVSRRPIFQTILFWDIFKHLYKKHSDLAYSSFFTNHVAGVMHRFWDEIFPEDFRKSASTKNIKTADFAMKILDSMLGDAIQWTKQNPNLILVFASSMGQSAVYRSEHHGKDLAVNEVEKLIRTLNKDVQFKPLLAMVPQVAVEILSPEQRGKVKKTLEKFQFESRAEVFEIEEIGSSLSITIVTPRLIDVDAGKVYLDQQAYDFSDLGITVNLVDAGTGYHIPEGIFAVYSEDENRIKSRHTVDSKNLKKVLHQLVSHNPEQVLTTL